MNPDNASAALRMIREPGLPPLFQANGCWTTALKLPAQYEPHRAQIEASLPVLT